MGYQSIYTMAHALYPMHHEYFTWVFIYVASPVLILNMNQL